MTCCVQGTIKGHEHSYQLDDHHTFVTGKPMLVCGNTAAMVGEDGVSWLAKNFQVRLLLLCCNMCVSNAWQSEVAGCGLSSLHCCNSHMDLRGSCTMAEHGLNGIHETDLLCCRSQATDVCITACSSV